MSLLRFVDPSNGRIIIDNIDITKIGLNDLRSRLTLISQETVLFAGTVRSNLDPFSERTDEEIVEVLERVAMNAKSISGTATPAEAVEGSQGVTQDVTDGRKGVTLDTLVSQGGNNFSSGQKQLLARE